MATMIPLLTERQLSELDSKAEAILYRECARSLNEDCTALHSLKWIVKTPRGQVRDGETDFLIVSPNAGLIVVEVKGGGISCDPTRNAWTSVDALGRRHDIKDPFLQAKSAKYAILGKLQEHPRWRTLGIKKALIGHAVFFPDVADVRPLSGSDRPLEIIGGFNDLPRLSDWLQRVFSFWRGNDPAISNIGEAGVCLIKEVFARPLEVKPLLSVRFAAEEQAHIQLTEQQANILDLLRGRRRVAIAGGAGTGKTLLALEKSRRLAAEGFKTLLVCYNRPLADQLARQCAGRPQLAVRSFHQLCAEVTSSVKRHSGRDLLHEAALAYPGGDPFDVHLPFALATALDHVKDRYDAIVVDEGQDFREEYWLPIEMMMADEESSPLYVFFDQNQAIYRRAGTFPVKDPPYVLTINCRNTRAIHEASYRFFRGDSTQPPNLDGLPVGALCAQSLPEQATLIRKAVCRLLKTERLSPESIVVLVGDLPRKQDYYDLLAQEPPGNVPWRIGDHSRSAGVLVDTVARFKGLEAPAVILWGIDGLDAMRDLELLYVGTSRAKSLLCLAGSRQCCDRLLFGNESST